MVDRDDILIVQEELENWKKIETLKRISEACEKAAEYMKKVESIVAENPRYIPDLLNDYLIDAEASTYIARINSNIEVRKAEKNDK